jgi:hypothetical protein
LNKDLPAEHNGGGYLAYRATFAKPGGSLGSHVHEYGIWGRSLPAGSSGEDRPRVSFRCTACLLLLFPLSAWAASSHHSHSGRPAPEDPGYVFALATANRFLNAWQTGDLETGTVLLSDHIRHSRNPDEIEQFFSGGADRAFEITHGKGNRGRRRFPVVLVTGEGRRVHRKFFEIILVNTGKNDWAVDRLP